MKALFLLTTILVAFSHVLSNNRDKQLVRTTTPVRDNVIKMGTIGACEWPSPRVHYPNISDDDHRNNNSVHYIPRGFMLHRCDRYSGCCAYEEYECGAIAERIVNIVVHAIRFDGIDLIQRLDTEVIVAKNHTKCGCRPVDQRLDNYEISDHLWHLID